MTAYQLTSQPLRSLTGILVPTEAELARRERCTYEPASALLARIKAERVVAQAKIGTRSSPARILKSRITS